MSQALLAAEGLSVDFRTADGRLHALRDVRLRDWWRVASRELASGLALGLLLGSIGFLVEAIREDRTNSILTLVALACSYPVYRVLKVVSSKESPVSSE